MDRGYGEIGDGSDISAAPLINAAAYMKGPDRGTIGGSGADRDIGCPHMTRPFVRMQTADYCHGGWARRSPHIA
jgi:hypothetical protein